MLVKCNPRRVSGFTRLQSPIRGAFRTLHACKMQSEARFGLYTFAKSNPRCVSDFTRLQNAIRGASRTLHACKVQSEARFGLYKCVRCQTRRVSHFARLVMTMMNQKKAGHMRCLHVLGPFFGARSAPYLNVINRLMYFPMMSNSRLTTVPLTMALKFVRSWV